MYVLEFAPNGFQSLIGFAGLTLNDNVFSVKYSSALVLDNDVFALLSEEVTTFD